MQNSIGGIGGIGRLNQLLLPAAQPGLGAGKAAASNTVDFQSMLADLLQDTNAADSSAQQAIGNYQLDGGITKPEVFIEMRKAELALRMTVQIRNKLVDAYKEIQQLRM